MKWFLIWLLGGTGMLIVLACLIFLVARGRLRRKHRVDHKVATGAPAKWMISPGTPARLHRRLVRVGQVAAAISEDHNPKRRLARRGELSPIGAAATDLKAQAITADRQLARMARLAPVARRHTMTELQRQVHELERAATALTSLSVQALTPRSLPYADGVADIRGQLERLAQAQHELDAIDADSGLAPARTNPLAPSSDAPPAARLSPPRPEWVSAEDPAEGSASPQ